MEQLLVNLIELRSEVAVEALTKTGDGSSFTYGHVSGQFKGLTMAIEAVQQMLADKEEDE